MRLEGWLYLLVQERIPVDFLEECVLLDFLYSSLSGAQTFLGILFQQTLQQGASGLAKNIKHEYFRFDNHLYFLVFVQTLLLERVDARQHLVNYQAQGPVIDFLAVPSSSDNFRSYVLWSTTKGEGDLFFFFFYFTQSKICYAQVALAINQDVFRFEISVDDSIIMQALQSQNHLGGVKTSSVLLESAIFLKMVKELSTVDIIHHEVQFIAALKG